jgi:exodeoxyribonuclease I
MQGTLLFYDIETTGLNRAFDQILEFAAIRTDTSLRELERETIKIRLRPDVIPHPEAMITHRISLKEAQQGICEYEAVTRIHRMFNRPNTITIGYNTLGFDDEFLRFSFYRNLLPPYRHQFGNGCFRMDVYPMTLIYWLFQRDGIEWPEMDGKPSLKLESLNTANHLAPGRAHEAMTDVAATLELARRLRIAPEVWTYLSACFDKIADKARIDSISASSNSVFQGYSWGLLVDGRFGYERRYLVPALSIGTSIPYANQEIWLRLDTPELAATTEDCIQQTTWAVRKRFGEPPIILPPKERFMAKLTPECRNNLEVNRRWICQHPELFKKIIEYHRSFRYPEIPNVDLDAALYLKKFMAVTEERICKRFHLSDIDTKVIQIKEFEEKHTRDLAIRLLWRNYPDALPDSLLRELSFYRKCINPATIEEAMVDFRGVRRTTPISVRQEICRMRVEREMDAEQLMLLSELESYITARFPENS